MTDVPAFCIILSISNATRRSCGAIPIFAQNDIANVIKYVGLRPPWLGRSSMIGIANAETVMQDVNVTWMSAIVVRRSRSTKEITG